jgi:hypothetical protein
MYNEFGVPKEPMEQDNPKVSVDWQGEPIYLTDNDSYIDFEGVWVLDDKDEIAEFIRYNYQSVNTYDMEE